MTEVVEAEVSSVYHGLEVDVEGLVVGLEELGALVELVLQVISSS